MLERLRSLRSFAAKYFPMLGTFWFRTKDDLRIRFDLLEMQIGFGARFDVQISLSFRHGQQA